MDALTLLTSRSSEKNLTLPAPNQEQLEKIFQAALHAPDHGKLKPYRFIVIENEGLSKLSDLLKRAVIELDLGEKRLQKAEKFSQKAPMVIAVVAKIDKTIEKVPAWEQMLCAGSATYAMQLAANAQGFDNVWVTAPWVNGTELRQALHCEANDKVIAFLLIGTAVEKRLREPKSADLTKFVSYL